MKFYFIINPNAGKEAKPSIEKQIKELLKEEDYAIYYTKGEQDATRYVREVCASTNEKIRFFACGGDGTVNEVASGLVNQKHASMVVYPCGSGNDFVRSFKNDFKDIKSFLYKEERNVDIISVNDRFSINVANIGFDADVNAGVIQLKKKMSIEKAYNKSLLKCFFQKFHNKYKITIDDKTVLEDSFIMFVCANGCFYGGGYHCAPKAKIDDGLIDFCAVKKISRLSFLRYIKQYKNGTYLDNEKLKNVFIFHKCQKVVIESKEPMSVSLDGEMIYPNKIVVKIIKDGINLVY